MFEMKSYSVEFQNTPQRSCPILTSRFGWLPLSVFFLPISSVCPLQIRANGILVWIFVNRNCQKEFEQFSTHEMQNYLLFLALIICVSHIHILASGGPVLNKQFPPPVKFITAKYHLQFQDFSQPMLIKQELPRA